MAVAVEVEVVLVLVTEVGASLAAAAIPTATTMICSPPLVMGGAARCPRTWFAV